MFPRILPRAWCLALCLPAGLPAGQVILDDSEPTVISSGTWVEATNQTGYFGGGYHCASNPATGPTWTWQVRLGGGGGYSVSASLPQAQSNRSTNVLYVIRHAAGTNTLLVDQTATEGWVSLGTYPFDVTDTAMVTASSLDDSGVVVADAVRFEGNGLQVTLDDASTNPDSTGAWTHSTFKTDYFGSGYKFASATNPASTWTWSAHVAGSNSLHLHAGLPEGGNDRAPAATYAVTDQSGTQTYTVDQRGAAGWNYLGLHTWTSSAPAVVTLSNASGGTYLIADAVRFDTDYTYVTNSFQVLPDQEHQIIQGLGVEIQFDSIGSGSSGLPEDITAVPNNLTEDERDRDRDRRDPCPLRNGGRRDGVLVPRARLEVHHQLPGGHHRLHQCSVSG